MKLYLDEDVAQELFVKLLRKDGHDVLVQSDIKMNGEKDARQMAKAIFFGRVFLTRNHDDFEALHELVVAAGGNHPGIFTIRFDNDSRRDMLPATIVRSIRALESSGIPIEDQVIVLNHWRG